MLLLRAGEQVEEEEVHLVREDEPCDKISKQVPSEVGLLKSDGVEPDEAIYYEVDEKVELSVAIL